MLQFLWLNLQLFADGAGDGGDGGTGAGNAETGENAVDAEQQRLLELNVPPDKVERWAKRKASREKRNGTVRTQEQPKPAATAETESTQKTEEAEEPENPDKEQEPKKPTFDELMKDPDYNRAMQETIKARLKTANAAEEFVKKAGPILAKQFGMDAENLDLASLGDSILRKNAEDSDEETASSMGISVDTLRKIRDSNRAEQETIQDKRLREHAERVIRESEELKKVIPGFDLMAERQNNEVFRRMVDNPDNPVPLEVAYRAVHHNELVNTAVQEAIKQTSQKMANSVQSGKNRPDEAGAARQAPSVATFDYSKASKAEREALKARIREAAARGEKIYPGR